MKILLFYFLIVLSDLYLKGAHQYTFLVYFYISHSGNHHPFNIFYLLTDYIIFGVVFFFFFSPFTNADRQAGTRLYFKRSKLYYRQAGTRLLLKEANYNIGRLERAKKKLQNKCSFKKIVPDILTRKKI